MGAKLGLIPEEKNLDWRC